MTQYSDESKDADREERRKGTGAAFLNLRQRVEQVCGAVGKADNIADLIDDVIARVSSLIDSADAREFLGEKDLGRIRDAADRFRSAKSHLDRIADACDKLKEVLKAAEDVLFRTPSTTGAPSADRGPFGRLVPWLAGGVLAAVLVGIVFLVFADDPENGPGFPTDTDTPEDTEPPTVCDELTDISLGIQPLNDFYTENEVFWYSEGGCAPYEVTIVAYKDGEDYEEYFLEDEPSGSLIDSVPSQCGGRAEVRYELFIIDGEGQGGDGVWEGSAQFGPC